MSQYLRPSKYSYLFESSKGKKLLYCTKGNSIIECSPNVFAILQEDRENKGDIIDKLPPDVAQELIRMGILCTTQDDLEFLEQMKFISQATQHGKQQFGLIIAPTLDCNFACPYCFEKHKRSSHMSLDIQEKLIGFMLSSCQGRPFPLYWYGGEALMAPQAIENILTNLKGKVQINKHVLITNGYLLTPDKYNIFDSSFPLDEVQITLDGSRERHNKLRVLKTDHSISTYDVILKNIIDFASSHPKCNIHVRVNVDKNNYADYKQTKELLAPLTLHNNILVYAGMIRLENKALTKSIEPAFSRREITQLAYNQAKQEGRVYELLPRPIYSKGCMANRTNAFIVGPQGEIYKCWNDVSDPEKVVGNICSEKITNPQLYYRYHSSCAWHNDPECCECLLMPVCNGKCAWYQIRNKFFGGQFNLCQCILKTPNLINQILEDYYDYITTPQEPTDSAHTSDFGMLSPA